MKEQKIIDILINETKNGNLVWEHLFPEHYGYRSSNEKLIFTLGYEIQFKLKHIKFFNKENEDYLDKIVLSDDDELVKIIEKQVSDREKEERNKELDKILNML